MYWNAVDWTMASSLPEMHRIPPLPSTTIANYSPISSNRTPVLKSTPSPIQNSRGTIGQAYF